MFNLILQNQIGEATLLLVAIIISLSFHEFGHAWTAKQFGDNTAERMGRLTLNPAAHIDPMGLLMVAMLSFGYAKPVPTNPSNFSSPQASLWISFAGPAMNLVLAVVFSNILIASVQYDFGVFSNRGAQIFFQYMAFINLILMLFNLLPIGPLDGHYILPYFLSRDLAYKYNRWNAQYGTIVLFSLIALSVLGLPIFSLLKSISIQLIPFLSII